MRAQSDRVPPGIPGLRADRCRTARTAGTHDTAALFDRVVVAAVAEIGGAWLITAQFDDTTLARKAAISFQIEVRDDEGQWYAWDADNSQDRRDGFFVAARGDSSWLMATTGSTGDNVTPTASGPAYPWKVPSLRYMSDDESGAGQTNLATPGWPSALTRRWAVPFADAFGNAQWFPGRVRLIVTNRSPSAAIKLLTIKAKGQRAY